MHGPSECSNNCARVMSTTHEQGGLHADGGQEGYGSLFDHIAHVIQGADIMSLASVLFTH